MGRKTILTVVAVLIASLGALLVFMYVKGVDDRAEAAQAPVQVLVATGQIVQGEKVADALEAGKIELQEVPGSQVLLGALGDTEAIAENVALTTVYPGEQIVQAKFGSLADVDRLGIEKKAIAISVQLSDPDRVAGFVSPGSSVAVFATLNDTTRLLVNDAMVIGVGATTTMQTTTTDESGAQTVEAIPTTILTLSLTQAEAEKVVNVSKTGQLTFGLLDATSETDFSAGANSSNLFQPVRTR